MRQAWTSRSVAAVTAATLAFASAQAAEKSPIEGAWDVCVTRRGWQPEATTGRLVLANAGGKWSGDLTFDVVLRAQKQKLADVVVKGDAVAFRLDSTEFDLRMDGKLEKGAIAGSCAWKGCGQFPWTAERPDGDPVERFEKGLTFDGFFPRGDAEKLGMDGGELDALIREASKNDTDALLVLRDGKVVVERTFGRAPGPIHVMSVTKFVAAFAAAMLLEDKKLTSLDAPLSTWFPDWNEGRRANVTLRHLLTHTSGIEHVPSAQKLNAEKDKVAYVRKLPVATEPGAEWSYNNEGAALVSGVLAQAAGRPVDDYLRERLFAPLGIRKFAWDRDEAGATLTYANLSLTARDLARIGQLVVDGGAAGAKRLLASKSIAMLSAPATPASTTQGLLWMLLRDGEAGEVVGVFHTGWLGQWIAVWPKQHTVAVRLRRWKSEADAERPEFQFGGFASRVAATFR
jgi:CubicO group peptidase (beta-lactamase class C family)